MENDLALLNCLWGICCCLLSWLEPWRLPPRLLRELFCRRGILGKATSARRKSLSLDWRQGFLGCESLLISSPPNESMESSMGDIKVLELSCRVGIPGWSSSMATAGSHLEFVLPGLLHVMVVKEESLLLFWASKECLVRLLHEELALSWMIDTSLDCKAVAFRCIRNISLRLLIFWNWNILCKQVRHIKKEILFFFVASSDKQFAVLEGPYTTRLQLQAVQRAYITSVFLEKSVLSRRILPRSIQTQWYSQMTPLNNTT